MTRNQDSSINKLSDPNYVDGVLDLLNKKLEDIYKDRPEYRGRDLETKVVTHAARLAINPLDHEAMTSWQSAQDALLAYDQSAIPTREKNDREDV